MRHPYVTDEMIETFARDGVVNLPQVLDSSWMQLGHMGVRRNLRNPGALYVVHYEGTPEPSLMTSATTGRSPSTASSSRSHPPQRSSLRSFRATGCGSTTRRSS